MLALWAGRAELMSLPLAALQAPLSRLGCDALFNTNCFIFLFLPVALLGYWLVPSRRWKLIWIGAMSILFYSFWDIRFVALLASSAVVDYTVARLIATATTDGVRKRWLLLSISFNLGVLGFFKYAIFALENANSILSLLGSATQLPYRNIVLPVGISFYTFQTMSYTIDVYRRVVEPTQDFIKYLAYVSLFPQLVAGPIVRYATLSKQLDELPVRPAPQLLALGVTLFVLGLAKKVLIADVIAFRIDPFWDNVEGLTTVTAWVAFIGYGLQLYFDFSGYSDMAIGLGALLGLRFPINFNAPYQAISPADFWRRWHISLSTFLRDYLYIPLGGNRRGPKRVLINLMAVMVLGGLWHGAAWTFVVWGAYHGGLLVLYQVARPAWDSWAPWLQRAATLSLVYLGWAVFRAPSLDSVLDLFGHMFLEWNLGGLVAQSRFIVALVAILVFTLKAPSTAVLNIRFTPARALALALLLLASIIVMNTIQSPFLYYQF